MKQNWRTWPNLFSSLRIALSWLPAYLLVTGSQDATLRWWALIIFVLIAATDGVDGWLARKLNQTSEWGMFIDPIGDKLLVGFAFIALYAVNWGEPSGPFLAVTLWVMFAREFILAAQIRIVQGGIVPPTLIGKFKTVVQFATVFIWMAPVFDDNMLLRGCSIGMAFGVTIISWVEYHQRYVAHGHLTTKH
ncbi:MAG: CDP-alcohol phosphatidyltransferase family protein [Candidatus Saccharimonadota bacterium]